MTEPLVSICIPSYQGIRWIRDSIASALAQDYRRFEVVVSDDASTDGTAEAAESVGDPRVRVLRSGRRLGMAANWNRSVQLAGGDYVKFLMQDDLLDPTCVSRMATILSRNPSVGFVFSLRAIIFEGPSDGSSARLARKLEALPRRLGPLGEVNDGRAIFDAMKRSGFRGNLIGEPTAVMVRRDALRRVGLFNTRLRQLTDLEMWLRLAFFFDVGFVPETLATFRLHPASATSANAAAGDAWLDRPWILEGLRTHPEIRPSLGLGTEARVWAGAVGAEGKRLVTHRGRGRYAYTSPIREFLRYRSHPTGLLHGRLDDEQPAETTWPAPVTTAVVVTYDSAAWIRACLGALADTPTIVVDNASRDDTVAIVRSEFPAVRVIARSDNGGFAVAVNEACRAAPDDDILLVNPDLAVLPGSVGILEEYLAAHPRVGIAVPRLVYPDGTLQTSIRTWPSPLTMLARRSPLGRTAVGRRILARHFYLDDPPRSAGPVHNAIGAAMLVRRDAIRAVGPMDERIFLYGEDLDWCYRMWQRGWEVHVVPDAVMEHAYERQSRRTLDLRSAATRHHWASILKLFVIHPSLLIGRGPRRAHEVVERSATKA